MVWCTWWRGAHVTQRSDKLTEVGLPDGAPSPLGPTSVGVSRGETSLIYGPPFGTPPSATFFRLLQSIRTLSLSRYVSLFLCVPVSLSLCLSFSVSLDGNCGLATRSTRQLIKTACCQMQWLSRASATRRHSLKYTHTQNIHLNIMLMHI